MYNSKIEIINHFDNLINQVDIDIEECLEEYNEEEVIGDLECYKSFKKKEENNNFFEMSESSMNKSYEIELPWLKWAKDKEERCENSNETDENPDDLEYDNNNNKIDKTVDLWSEETKVVDYLNQVRMRTIEELREAQKEALDNYKSKSDDSKFYFQVIFYRKREKWIFKLFTFLTDFYMSPNDIEFLEKFINSAKYEKSWYYEYTDKNFDEKTVLIGLFDKFFFENLDSEKFPSPVISVRKRDLLAIKHISFHHVVNNFFLDSSTIDLPNLESLDISIRMPININGFSSLESLSLRLFSNSCCLSFNNLPSLRHLKLGVNSLIDSTNQPKLFDYLPSIQYLTLYGELSNFNLDSLVNLKSLSLEGKLQQDFNFDLFKNICNRLEELSINLKLNTKKALDMMLCGHVFPCLITLSICNNLITKFDKKLLEGFPMLQSLTISDNRLLQKIDNDAFSNLKQLISLDLSHNFIKSLSNDHFSALSNLKYLNLNRNVLESIDESVFLSLKNLTVLDLSQNRLYKLKSNSFPRLNLKFLDI